MNKCNLFSNKHSGMAPINVSEGIISNVHQCVGSCLYRNCGITEEINEYFQLGWLTQKQIRTRCLPNTNQWCQTLDSGVSNVSRRSPFTPRGKITHFTFNRILGGSQVWGWMFWWKEKSVPFGNLTPKHHSEGSHYTDWAVVSSPSPFCHP